MANSSRTRIPAIVGTKPSVRNSQLLASTGIPSLDHVIGGGQPVGAMLIVEEDTYGTYSKVMLKYFMAEGVVVGHPLFVASQDVNPSQLISEMPTAVAETTVHSQVQDTVEELKIAWRYQNMGIVDASPIEGQTLGHYYDLTKPMNKEIIQKAQITEWYADDTPEKSTVFENMHYLDLLKRIQKTLIDGQYLISDAPEKRQLLRIAIHSLSSRLWFSDHESNTRQDLLKFLYCLRALLRNSYSIAVITIPVENFDNSDAVVERIEHLSDISVRLESFAGSAKETNPLFKDYHGLLHIRKLPALNTLAPHSPDSRDLAFKLRRKKFLIEVLHLPPELGDTAQREQDETATAGMGCMSGGRKNLLDF